MSPATNDLTVSESTAPSSASSQSLRFPDQALPGLLGRIVRKIEPQTEAHPAGIALTLMAQFGNAAGPHAYFTVEQEKHHANLFVMVTGESSKARKGSGNSQARRVMSQIADMGWMNCRHLSGLSSGEGVIFHIQNQNDRDREDILHLNDTRLMINAGEFGQTLSAMSRPGNNLSAIIRNCWDGAALDSPSKNNPLHVDAGNHHVSITANITQPDLQKQLEGNDQFNGFANRFLWVLVNRTKYLPFGGEPVDLTDEIRELREALEFAQCAKEISIARNAEEFWEPHYNRIERETNNNALVDAVTDRAGAQVRRLALIYTLLDQKSKTDESHLRAALAAWEYCRRSAALIFGGLTRDQEKIVQALELHAVTDESPWLNRSALYKIFHNHKDKDELEEDLQVLIDRQAILHQIMSKKDFYRKK